MLHALVHRLTHVGHRRLPSASTPGRGSTAPAAIAALRALLLGSLVASLVIAAGLTVLYASAAVDSLVGDLLVWFAGVTAVAAIPSAIVYIGRRLYR